MSDAIDIRILEKDNNRRGDLFGRFMGDLFLSLGYDDVVRLNIARTGREIDIEAEHRLESRRALAERKAQKKPVGGMMINTFRGSVEAERVEHPEVLITPFFISLSSFTQTAIDQEAKLGKKAIILLDGPRIVEELITGRILIPLDKATEKADQCVADQTDLVRERVELLAHERGWVWAVYYTQGKQPTHVVLIHSDGTPLAASVAQDVIAADRSIKGSMHELICLNPDLSAGPDTSEQASAALAQYYMYLAAECGYILLDGLPADAEVGTRRLQLENLFVPLSLVTANHDDGPGRLNPEAETDTPLSGDRRSVGDVLAEHTQIAILASPGGGKSTLLKRLAVAYADPERRLLTDDHLPDRSLLPLFFRCRELRDKARAPFSELVDALAERAALGERADAFRNHLDRALRDGQVLLLVDGLDEIADPGDRTAFVRNLRTFLAIYPNISLVVTTREAGFRHVASLLAAVCLHTRLADFDADDIRRLSVAWHREVVGDRPEVIADAENLASTIVDNDRIQQLAVNPLLLTTLLLVKRWVGQLPTRRSVLYGKAVEVLLMTWNVEGHDPIEQDEALPQLCYIAYSMMQRGEQKISRPDLTRLLRDAREQLTAELAFARIGITEFIERVEHRSSLLMMTGHDVVDGTLTEFYEFRHLTFQEYLTAKAVVEGWHPSWEESNSLVSLLEPHFKEEEWREVVPLAAVLAGGRKADGLVQRLTERLAADRAERTDAVLIILTV